MIVELIDHGISRVAQPRSTLCHGVQDRLDISRRTGDNAQDFARGRLLFAGFGELSLACLKLLCDAL
jgi:hypothetical protein